MGKVLSVLLILMGLGLVTIGAVTLTQVSLGVGLIGIACFFGILARVAQADAHHNEIVKQGGKVK